MFCDKNQNSATPPADQNNPNLNDLLKNYLNLNNKTGYLIFQVYQDSILYGRLPISNARITLCKSLGDEAYVCKVITTDMNGQTEPTPVPTASAEIYQTPVAGITNCNYYARIEAPGFNSYEIFNLPAYDGITSIQNVRLSPVNQFSSSEPQI